MMSQRFSNVFMAFSPLFSQVHHVITMVRSLCIGQFMFLSFLWCFPTLFKIGVCQARLFLLMFPRCSLICSQQHLIFNPIFFWARFTFYVHITCKGGGAKGNNSQSMLLFWGRETYLHFYVGGVLCSKNIGDGFIVWFLL